MARMNSRIRMRCSLLHMFSAVKVTGIAFFLQKSSTKTAFSIILNGVLGFALYFLMLSGCSMIYERTLQPTSLTIPCSD